VEVSEMTTEIMIDLETLGTSPGCAILQIGAVAFDRTTFDTRVHPPFEATITTASSEVAGFTASPSTAAWWATQPEAARKAVMNPPDAVPLLSALNAFRDWWSHLAVGADDLILWTQGNFDAPILEAALRRFEIQTPWKFWNVRDTRTAYDVLLGPDGRKLIKSLPRFAPEHTALGDAVHQVACLKRAYEVGNNRQGKWAS
jgi:3' exoribonuclease, RNase T-like